MAVNSINFEFKNNFFKSLFIEVKKKRIPNGNRFYDYIDSVEALYSSLSVLRLFAFVKRIKPSKKHTMHTAEPRVAFIITISVSFIPSNDTSIPRHIPVPNTSAK